MCVYTLLHYLMIYFRKFFILVMVIFLLIVKNHMEA